MQIARSLAKAVLSGNLAYEPSEEPVLISKDASGSVQNVWLSESSGQLLVAEVKTERLTELSRAYVADLLVGLLTEIAHNPSAKLRRAHRLIRVRRGAFRSWLADLGYTPPQFWFPSPTGVAKDGSDPNRAGVRQRKKDETKLRDDAIRYEAKRIRKKQPRILTIKVAELIARDQVLNPSEKLSEATIRRILYRKPLSAKSKNRAHTLGDALIQKR
jgi:hypothetical protein